MGRELGTNEGDKSTPFSIHRVFRMLFIVVLLLSPASLSLSVGRYPSVIPFRSGLFYLYSLVGVPCFMWLAIRYPLRADRVAAGVAYCIYYIFAVFFIPNEIQGDSMGMWLFYVGMPIMLGGLLLGMILLMVPCTRYDGEARRMALGLCRKCGYDLQGRVSDFCSECGCPVDGEIVENDAEHSREPD